jgi:predicted transcriptional regulator
MKENKLTGLENSGEIRGFSSAKELYYILSKVLINRGIKKSDFHDKTKIDKTSHARYISGLDKKYSVSPKLPVLMEFADFLGYEIVLLKKNK